MAEQSVKERIAALCAARGWSCYRLAKESGIPYSTLNTMLNKTGTPSIASLEKICAGFGITMAQFFDVGNETASLTREERSLLETWAQLSAANRKTATAFLAFLRQQND